MNEEIKTTKKISLEKVSYYLIILSAFLLPITVISQKLFSLTQFKSYLLGIFVVPAFFCYVASRLLSKKISVTKSVLFHSLLLLPLVYAISSVWSIHPRVSFMSAGFEMETLHFVGLLCILSFLVFKLFRTSKEVSTLFGVFTLSITLIFLFEAVRLFTGQSFGLNALSLPFVTLVGTWNDLSIFSGLFLVMAVIALDVLPLKKSMKMFIGIFSLIPVLFIILSNFKYSIHFATVHMFFVLALVALAIVANKLYTWKKLGNVSYKNIWKSSSVLFFVVFLVLAIFGNSLSEKVSPAFNFFYSEGRPSWKATADISAVSLKENPILGYGPQSFSYAWNLNKPKEFSLTEFWNNDYFLGVGFVPTSLITTGIFGLTSWILLIVCGLYFSSKILLVDSKSKFESFLKTSVSVSTIFLLVNIFFYTPSASVMFITFLFLGLCLAISAKSSILNEREFVIGGEGRIKNLLSTIITVSVLCSIFVWGYSLSKKVIASSIVNIAVAETTNPGDFREKMLKAISFDFEPQYLWALAGADISQLVYIGGLSRSEVELASATIQVLVNEAVAASIRAEELNQYYFRSKLNTSSVYDSLAAMGIPGAEDAAKNKSAEAKALNPHSPLPYFTEAQSLIGRGKVKDAENSLLASLERKNNFTDAYVLLANIAFQQGRKTQAEGYLEQAASSDPFNQGLLHDLALLNIEKKNYQLARDLLQRTVLINPSFANARYYLSLSLYKLGDKVSALRELENLLPQNKDNKFLIDSIEQLKSGNDPFINPFSEPVESDDEDNATTTKKETKK